MWRGGVIALSLGTSRALTSDLLSLLTLFYVAVLTDQETARIIDALKILVPAISAGIGGWYIKKQEDAKGRERQEAAERERLSDGWGQLTAQSREIIDRLQTETVEARAQCSAAMENVKGLERELEDTKNLYRLAMAEIEELKERRTRTRDSGERPRPKPKG